MLRHAGLFFVVGLLLACDGTPPSSTGLDASTDRGVDVSLATDAPPARCTSDRECSASGRVCNTATARCVECNAAADCGAGRACLGNRCITPVTCTTSRQCPGQVCAATLGYCVDCNGDVDCSGGQLCRGNACVAPPRMCRSSRECSDMGQVCDTTRSQCVDCVGDTDCPMDRYCGPDSTCLARVCTPNASECVSATRVRVCDARGSSQRESDCASGQTCRGGACQAPVCTPGQASCDPMTSQRRACNADGSGYAPMPCTDGESCRDGMCVTRSCTPGMATCASMTERRVCANDGLSAMVVACAAGEGCRDGACVMRACTPGTATCTSSTVRGVCNADGFGTTPTPCGAMQRCSGGACVDLACTPGTSSCVDARTVRVCAADGSSAMTLPCPGSSTCTGTMCSSWVCTPGMATCPSGTTSRTVCNADGLATRSEPCVAPANAGMARCGDGNACTFTCNAGFGDCNMTTADGCETALATSVANCGRCGNACAPRPNTTVSCAASTCTYACSAGFGDCDGNPANGCEVDTRTSAANCGRCGNACATGQACSGGACTARMSGYVLTAPPADATFIELLTAPGATRVLNGVDDGAVPVGLPFAFPFWGTMLPAGHNVNICSNGFMSLDGIMNAATNGRIPSTGQPNGVIAAWWRDLRLGDIYYATIGSAPSRKFVVEWMATPFEVAYSIRVEVVLNESNGAIDMFMVAFYMTPPTDTATVGVESLDGMRAVGGCGSGMTTVCTTSVGNRIRFAPVP